MDTDGLPGPVERQNLSDELAQRVRQLIQTGGYQPGDRLPSIVKMARHFGVAHPTLREALRKLETLGVVDIRHGSGVYVGEDQNALLITNPLHEGGVTRKLLLDLVEARIPVEVKSVSLAAGNASGEHLARMRAMLAGAGENLDDSAAVSEVNLAFHREIALASGNQILHQLLEVLGGVIQEEQRFVNETYRMREKLHREHLEILDALERRDVELAAARMQAHLEGVREALTQKGTKDSQQR